MGWSVYTFLQNAKRRNSLNARPHPFKSTFSIYKFQQRCPSSNMYLGAVVWTKIMHPLLHSIMFVRFISAPLMRGTYLMTWLLKIWVHTSIKGTRLVKGWWLWKLSKMRKTIYSKYVSIKRSKLIKLKIMLNIGYVDKKYRYNLHYSRLLFMFSTLSKFKIISK